MPSQLEDDHRASVGKKEQEETSASQTLAKSIEEATRGRMAECQDNHENIRCEGSDRGILSCDAATCRDRRDDQRHHHGFPLNLEDTRFREPHLTSPISPYSDRPPYYSYHGYATPYLPVWHHYHDQEIRHPGMWIMPHGNQSSFEGCNCHDATCGSRRRHEEDRLPRRLYHGYAAAPYGPSYPEFRRQEPFEPTDACCDGPPFLFQGSHSHRSQLNHEKHLNSPAHPGAQDPGCYNNDKNRSSINRRQCGNHAARSRHVHDLDSSPEDKRSSRANNSSKNSGCSHQRLTIQYNTEEKSDAVELLHQKEEITRIDKASTAPSEQPKSPVFEKIASSSTSGKQVIPKEEAGQTFLISVSGDSLEAEVVKARKTPSNRESEPGNQLSGSPCSVADIRGTIGAMNDLQLSMEGVMFKQAWSEDPALTLTSESYVNDVVHAWKDGIKPAKSIDFEQLTRELPDRADCEFDPATLEFRPPLDPEEEKEDEDEDEQHRRQRRQGKNPATVESKGDRKIELSLQASEARRMKEDQARAPATPRDAEPREALEPPFACHLRPVVEEDLKAIHEMYNLEITEGFQGRDKVKISLESFASLLRMCQARSLPFIAAEAGSSHDLREGKAANVSWFSREPSKGNVLGFSFLSPYHRGFCNSLDSAGNSSVRMDVVVHPDHRSRFIGTALIDKMLQLTCPRYEYMDTCQFVDTNAVSLYRGAKFSLHKFYHLYTDVLVAGDDDPNAVRFDKLFLDRFGFEKLCIVRGSHQHRRGMMDLVTYHKQCRPVAKPTRDGMPWS